MIRKKEREKAKLEAAESLFIGQAWDRTRAWNLNAISQHTACKISIQNATSSSGKQEVRDNLATLHAIRKCFDPEFPGASLAEERIGPLGTENPVLAMQ
jgi:hypothetical protein